MLKQALTSITFRGLSAREVLDTALRAGIDAIEWGGDIHVPAGDTAIAEAVGNMTRAAGLSVCAYGSYHRAGTHENAKAAFRPVLESAVALGARRIRVWAGNQGSAEFSGKARQALFEALAGIVEMAAAEGITIATEYHARTFTDTLATTQEMLAAVPGLTTFWQPPVGLAHAENLRALDALAGRAESVHVYEWTAAGERRPLREGEARWPAYLRRAAAWPGPHYCTTEFVAGDAVSQFLDDAAVLAAWIAEING